MTESSSGFTKNQHVLLRLFKLHKVRNDFSLSRNPHSARCSLLLMTSIFHPGSIVVTTNNETFMKTWRQCERNYCWNLIQILTETKSVSEPFTLNRMINDFPYISVNIHHIGKKSFGVKVKGVNDMYILYYVHVLCIVQCL
jgi:hypothetical protein